MNYETGEFVWLDGYIKSQVMQKSDIEKIKNNSTIVGKDYNTIGVNKFYRFLTKVSYDTPKAGLVLGYSNRNTGYVDEMYSSADMLNMEPPEYQGNYLSTDSTIKVMMVMPLRNKLTRYHTPIAVLVEQLRKIE